MIIANYNSNCINKKNMTNLGRLEKGVPLLSLCQLVCSGQLLGCREHRRYNAVSRDLKKKEIEKESEREIENDVKIKENKKNETENKEKKKKIEIKNDATKTKTALIK